jgi:hypothetical protein
LTTDISLPLTILFADRHHLALKRPIVVRIRPPRSRLLRYNLSSNLITSRKAF